MPERSANISTHDPFGSLLGYAPGGIAIYSSDYHTADEKEYPDDAAFRSYLGREYMGYKWQCGNLHAVIYISIMAWCLLM